MVLSNAQKKANIMFEYRKYISHRTVFGHSFGGLLATYSMLQKQNLFQAYILSDPSVWWDNALVPKELGSLQFAGDIRKVVYVGESDSTQAFGRNNSIASSIQSFVSHYEADQRFAYKFYDKESHDSLPVITFIEGIRFIFSGYAIDYEEAVKGKEVIDSYYDKISQRLGYRVKPNSELLDFYAGWSIYMHQKFEEGISLLETSASYSPDSASTLTMLGDAYLNSGKFDDARAVLKRALKLQPDNVFANELLKAASKDSH
jgi:tetratricopeptide (TPR) repeat protein